MAISTVHLSGYFDNNFGDDYMMKIIIESLPEIKFLIDKRENVGKVLMDEDNVELSDSDEISKYPKLIVTGSGFMINSKKALISELIFFLKRKHPGEYCIGCNIEPLNGKVSKFLIKRKLNKFRLIICRDKKSLSWLEKNVKRPRIKHLSDILFSLPDEWIRKEKKGKKLGISLMHRKSDEANCLYYKKMAEIADFWVEKNGENVLLMAFDSGTENDVFSCECVKKIMKHSQNAEIVIHRNGDEIFDAYSECSKIIGARHHSLVLALRMGLPVFPVIYREKMKNLIEDISYPVKGCNIDEIDVDKIKAFLEKEDDSLNDVVFSDISEYKELFIKALGKD